EAGHVNFKTMNKLVKGNLVRGLLSKTFENDHTCVTCQKGKQHKASYSLLPTIFWAEAVNTACYILNRILVTKPHNKTPYELIIGSLSIISFMRPFGCPVTILNTLDPLGKFDGKEKEGFLVRYSVNNKAFRKSVSPDNHSSSSGAQTRNQGDKTENKDKGKSPVVTITRFRDLNAEFKEYNNNSSNRVNIASSLVSTARQNSIDSTNNFSAAGPSNAAMPNLEDLSHNTDDVGAEADINNLESIISARYIPKTRIHKDHLTSQIIGDLSSTTQTRSMARAVRDQGGISQMFNEDFHTCIIKKDERGIVIRNKARLVAQGHTQEEDIDYEKVFSPVARIEAIRLFLAYASFMGFPVYQMDDKSAFLYGTIEEEVYVCQPPGFEDP
nr:hypothetical protein [Tanacetum cinerariifolium]